MAWTAERVLAQSRRWVSPWSPPTATKLTVRGYEFYMLGRDATLMSYRGSLPSDEAVIAGAVEVARSLGAATLAVTVSSDTPGSDPVPPSCVPTNLITTASVDDILAMDREAFADIVVETPITVQVREVSTRDAVAQFERTTAAAWGYPPPAAEDIDAAASRLEPGWFLAFLDGMPAGTGGFTLVDNVARFWGAAVLPSARGRGVYRALVAARLASAAARGASLALVHAAPTSSPILQRIGFRKFGERRTYAIHLAPK